MQSAAQTIRDFLRRQPGARFPFMHEAQKMCEEKIASKRNGFRKSLQTLKIFCGCVSRLFHEVPSDVSVHPKIVLASTNWREISRKTALPVSNKAYFNSCITCLIQRDSKHSITRCANIFHNAENNLRFYRRDTLQIHGKKVTRPVA